MATLEVLNWDKKVVGKVEVSDLAFDRPLRQDLLQSVVRWQLAKRRQGTHCVKTRSTIAGSSKKPFKQKGTGNARQGNKRSPLMEGGAVVHGPQPRNYEFALTRKVKQAALATALSYLQREGRCFVLESIGCDSGKTKDMAATLKRFGVNKALLVGGAESETLQRAARNLKDFKLISSVGINVYDLLKYDTVLLSQDVLTDLQARCGVN